MIRWAVAGMPNALGALLSAALLIAGCSAPPTKTQPVSATDAREIGAETTATEVRTNSPTESVESTRPVRPTFSGHWVRNEESSDDLQEKLAELSNSVVRGGGMGSAGQGRGRAGGMGGMSGMAGMQGRTPPAGMRGNMGFDPAQISSTFSGLESLDITHEDPMLTIVGRDGHPRRIFTDFRGASVSSNGMQQQVTIAAWEGDVLVVETTPNRGPRLVQEYRIDRKSGQLVIVSALALPQGKKPLVIRSVYDRGEKKLPPDEPPLGN